METFDVTIIGAGPAGLVLSTCLARWGYRIKHIDNRSEPTPTGRADGIQPRSLDMLRNMGLKRKIMAREPARVYEVAFWDPGERGITRTGTWASCPSFIDARYPFTTLLHQGHIERVFLEDMEENGVRVQRPWRITGFENDGADAQYPVRVELAHVDGRRTETVRTKYLFGGEGARSFVREKLGIPVHYKDPIAHVWGVMDGVVRTDFPDIKMKCTIHSDAGSIMVIPREDNMVRLYIQLASSSDPDFDPRKTATEEEVMIAAKRILRPYSIEWESVVWYSIYPIGQGISERYTLDERVFLGGDACHTHSPKAGQGMNAAFLDALNLAWKIHHVEAGFAQRSILSTYESERKHVAEELLAFDAKYAALFSARHPSSSEANAAATTSAATSPSETESEFVKTFKENCEFTSGYGVAYAGNVFNWTEAHSAKHPLFLSPGHGTTLRPGRTLTPASVTRVADANIIHLEHAVPLNGAFRLFIFAGRLPSSSSSSGLASGGPKSALADLAAGLSRGPRSLLGRFGTDPSSDDGDDAAAAAAGPRFLTLTTVLAARRAAIADALLLGDDGGSAVPALLARHCAHVYADDVPDARVPGVEAPAHAKMGIDPADGAVVVVRPDGYVGCVVRLAQGQGTTEALEQYFGAFVAGRLGGDASRL